MPKIFLRFSLLPPQYKLYYDATLEFEAVPLGRLIAEFTRIAFALISNTERNFMFVIVFVLFVTMTIAQYGGS